MSYDALTVIHSLAAYVWLGSLLGTLLATTIGSRKSISGLINGARIMVRFSTMIGLPAAIILLVTGIWMIVTGNGPTGGTWVMLGFVAWLAAAIVGNAMQHPAARKMRKAKTEAEAANYARRIALIGGAQIVVVVFAIWVMGAQLGS